MTNITDYRSRFCKGVDYGQRVASSGSHRVNRMCSPLVQMPRPDLLSGSNSVDFLQLVTILLPEEELQCARLLPVSVIYNPTPELKPWTWHQQRHIPSSNVLWSAPILDVPSPQGAVLNIRPTLNLKPLSPCSFSRVDASFRCDFTGDYISATFME